jgi:putative FmdB family regulatory protein
MLTYEYECSRCGLQFERQQTMTDAPIKECPACGEEVRKLMKSCSLEETGKTCCGADRKCGESHCEG